MHPVHSMFINNNKRLRVKNSFNCLYVNDIMNSCTSSESNFVCQLRRPFPRRVARFFARITDAQFLASHAGGCLGKSKINVHSTLVSVTNACSLDKNYPESWAGNEFHTHAHRLKNAPNPWMKQTPLLGDNPHEGNNKIHTPF